MSKGAHCNEMARIGEDMSNLIIKNSDSDTDEQQRIPDEAVSPWLHRLQEANSEKSQDDVLQQMAPEADAILVSLTNTLASGIPRYCCAAYLATMGLLGMQEA